MLERLRLIDFKSFVDEEAELSPLTLLVGANASGKSNFLDALRFLQQTVIETSFSKILEGEERAGVERWPGIRGGARETARVGASVFTLETTWQLPALKGVLPASARSQEERGEPIQLTHRIACRTMPTPMLEAESLAQGRKEGSLIQTGAIRGDEIEVRWAPSEPGSTATFVPRDESVISTILGGKRPYSPSLEAVNGALALADAQSSIQSLAIKPEEMRGYGRRSAPLGEEGKNISGVLARLCDDLEEKRTLVEWLVELCAPDLVDLDFIEVPEIGDVMAVLVEKGGRRITARSASDGTLRFLGILVALRTAEPGSMILIEEIESDLHPTRIRLLVEYLEAAARERGLQIIATTHSPVVLQWLREETLLRALVFGRIPEKEGTVMRRLGDLPHFRETVQRKGIDELFTTGWLEMAL